MKVYVESSVLTDWLFLDTVELGRARTFLGQETRLGYSLFRNVLRRKYPNLEFLTSYWAISETLQNYLRSYAMFNMLFDNLSLRYFEVVRDYPRYKMSSRAFREAEAQILRQLKQAEKRGRLQLLQAQFRPEILHKYVWMGLDATNAKHLALAIDQVEASIFVTKDRDFHDREQELEKFHIDIQYPSETFSSLKRLG